MNIEKGMQSESVRIIQRNRRETEKILRNIAEYEAQNTHSPITEQLDIEGPSITNCFQLVFRGNHCIFGLSISIKTEYFNFESIYNLSKMYRSYLQSIRPWSSHL